MPQFSDLKTITMLAGDTGYDMPNAERISTYIFTGSGTRAASYAITAIMANALTVAKPNRVRVIYQGNWVLNGNEITVFGTHLTQEQAASGNVTFDCFYNGSSWTVQVVNNPKVRTYAATNSVDISAGVAIVLSPNIDGKFLTLSGTGTLAANSSVSPSPFVTMKDGEEFFIKYEGTLIPNGKTITIFGEVLTDAEVLYGNLTVHAYYDFANTAWVTQKYQNLASLYGQVKMITVPVSFEASAQGNNTIVIPYNATLTAAYATATLAIAGTDNATIEIQIGSTPVTGSATPLTFPAGNAIDSTISTTLTAANIVTAGNFVNFVAAKTTAGGSALVTLILTRTP